MNVKNIKRVAAKLVANDREREALNLEMRTAIEQTIGASGGKVTASMLAKQFGVSNAFICDLRRGRRDFGIGAIKRLQEAK